MIENQISKKPDNTRGKQAVTLFKPGQSGNPNGRPKGSRNKLSEEFIRAVYKDFEQYGVEAIQAVRLEKPEAYLKVIASIIPKEMNLKVDPLEELTDEQLLARAIQLSKAIGFDRIIQDHFGAGTEAEAKPAGGLPPVSQAG